MQGMVALISVFVILLAINALAFVRRL